MPSPAKLRRCSSSDPELSGTRLKAESFIVGRRQWSGSSASSNRPRKSSYWTSWSNINKLGDYISLGGKGGKDSCSCNNNSKHSDLTEESLVAHNKLHGVLSHKAHISNYIIGTGSDRNSSPYYRGLIDLTLSISKERNMSMSDSPALPPPPPPPPESHVSTISYAPSSISSFLNKVQEYGSSCFTCTIKPAGNNNKDPSPKTKPVASNSSTSFAKGDEKKEAPEGKPLRERVLEPPKPTIILPKKEANIQMEYQKFILADKYRPKALKDFICNRSEAARLQALVKQGGCGHLIFEGPPGAGKRTMILAMLREAFGADRVQTRDGCKAFELKGESVGRIEVQLKESSQHVEVNLSDLRGYEKHVIVELMKETQSLTTIKSNKASSSFYPDNCRAIVLCEADKLSTDALLYIRWLLERYKGSNKVFFCCSDISKLQPIRSLCTLIKLQPPSQEEIVEVLEFVAKQEGIFLPRKFAEKIADSAKNNNLRQAIRSFEACWHSSYPFKEDQEILTGWEEDIANISKNIVEERSPKQLYIIRGKLQILIEHDVSPDFIFKSLVEELKKHLHENLHPQVDSLYDEYS
ncbi:hypothetical protein CCACVL1_07914, partial [Corchorus capsularis]